MTIRCDICGREIPDEERRFYIIHVSSNFSLAEEEVIGIICSRCFLARKRYYEKEVSGKV